MANVSSSNGLEKYPKLRFPQFSNAYTQAVLGDVFEYERPDAYIVSSEQYSDIYPTPVLTANQAFILGYTNEEHGIYNKGEVILFDDFTCDTKFANFPFKVKSSAMKLLRTKNGIPISYAYELLRYINYKPEGHARHWISIMQPLEVWLPQIDEQIKVGEFLAKITEKIDKQKSLIELLKKYKRGVVKAIFSGKLNLSDEYPFEIWENKAICECLKYEQPQKYIVATEKYDDSFTTPVLTANKGFILGYTDEQQGIYDKGDVIIYDDFTMDMKYVTFNFKVKSSTIKMLTPTQENDLYFIYSLLQSLELQPEGHQRSYISKVEPMIVQVPPYELQLQISEFLKNIDNRVVSAEKQLALLVTQKQGLMQGLFA